MKAKVFVFLFCFLFLFTSISNIFAAEITDDYEVRYGTDVSLDDIKSKDSSSGGYFSKFKYYYILYTHESIYCYYFNDLNLLRYTVTDNNSLSPVFDASEENVLRRVVYDLGTYNIVSNVEFTSSIGLIELPRVGYSNENYYLLAHNFDIIYNDVLIAPSMDDDTIGDLNSRLQVTYEYNEDNTECKINATIVDGSFTDKIYYSNYMPSISGQGLITKKPFPVDGITITDNQSLFFQAEDKDGNIIATNSISIYNIGKLSPDLFNVTFNFSKGSGTSSWVDVFPSIADNQSIYYDLYYKIFSDQELIASATGHYAREFTQINNNEKMNFQSIIECKFTLYFEVRNSVTGNVALTKSYDIVLDMQAGSGVNDNTNGGITGGTVNGEPVFDFDFEYKIDWSLPAAVENIKNFFETSEEFFNLVIVFLSSLPMWIIMPIYTFLILAGIIFVFHAIRG